MLQTMNKQQKAKVSEAARVLGALGGKKTSAFKKRSSRKNGALGGRPRKGEK
jgi:hypothetical protein